MAKKKAKKTTTTRKKKVVKRAPKKVARKKTTETKAASAKDKAHLKQLVSTMLTTIRQIDNKQDKIQKHINSLQKKLSSAKNRDKKLSYTFEIEGAKIDAFTKVEKDYQKMSQHLNDAYACALKIGGNIKNDFLSVCQDISNGINFPRMVKHLKKVHKSL